MGRSFLWAAAVLVCGHVALASVDVTFTRDGGLSLGVGVEGVVEGETHSIELWLTNTSPSTTALSAYQFNFEGGDFDIAMGKLDATNWAEGSVFDGLIPAWIPNDQSLDTANVDYVVDGVTGSLSTPFVGPGLPLDTAVLIGTFDVYIDALEGEFVDFLLSDQSGIDDQNGNLAGAGIDSLGVSQVEVIPEPTTVGLLALGSFAALRRRRS